MNNKEWETHYKRDKSSLSYPDENLVRLLSKFLNLEGKESVSALDMGCGSGRHLKLMNELGIDQVFGSDYSFEGLKRSGRFANTGLVNSSNMEMPFKDCSFDIVVSWGSLHYSHKEDTRKMIDEVMRILKKGGAFLGTLRCDNDSYLKRGRQIGDNTWSTDLHDLTGSVVSFFSLDELKELFRDFNSAEFGLMERTIMGDLERRISHWIFSVTK